MKEKLVYTIIIRTIVEEPIFNHIATNFVQNQNAILKTATFLITRSNKSIILADINQNFVKLTLIRI